MEIYKLIICIAPVLFFIFFLYLLDSFKLVLKNILLFSLVWGAICAGLSYFINSYLIARLGLEFRLYSFYMAPVVEEVMKSLFVLWIFKKNKAGFMIDAAIYGFAVGAGFSIFENIVYLNSIEENNLLIWITRGLGTSLMHGGCTSIFSILLLNAKSRDSYEQLFVVIAYLVIAIIHSAFNHFFVNPVLQTLLIIILLPVLFLIIISGHNKHLHKWLEIEFGTEVELLCMINKGQFSSTRSGEYLVSIKDRFKPEQILDMYCYIKLYLELSIKAKRNIMLKESGFDPIIEEDVKDKLTELSALRKCIGTVGEMALSPLIRMNYRNLWQLSTMKE